MRFSPGNDVDGFDPSAETNAVNAEKPTFCESLTCLIRLFFKVWNSMANQFLPFGISGIKQTQPVESNHPNPQVEQPSGAPNALNAHGVTSVAPNPHSFLPYRVTDPAVLERIDALDAAAIAAVQGTPEAEVQPNAAG